MTILSNLIGKHVRILTAVENYPIILLPAGETGTVTEVDSESIWVRLDKHHTELNEWNNALQVYWDDRPAADLVEVTVATSEQPPLEYEIPDMRVTVEVIGFDEKPFATSFENFLRDNYCEEEEAREIERALRADGVYHGGGGAQPEFRVCLLPAGGQA